MVKLTAAHSKQKLKFTQRWKDNMKSAGKPKVEKCTAKEAKMIGTLISFYQITNVLVLKELVMICMLQRRAYDVAATTDKRVCSLEW